MQSCDQSDTTVCFGGFYSAHTQHRLYSAKDTVESLNSMVNKSSETCWCEYELLTCWCLTDRHNRLPRDKLHESTMML